MIETAINRSEAYRKRLNRAKKSAEKMLKEKGFVVFEIDNPVFPASLISIDPETSRAKIIKVSLEEKDISQASRFKGFGEIKIEIWHRKPREIGFHVFKI